MEAGFSQIQSQFCKCNLFEIFVHVYTLYIHSSIYYISAVPLLSSYCMQNANNLLNKIGTKFYLSSYHVILIALYKIRWAQFTSGFLKLLMSRKSGKVFTTDQASVNPKHYVIKCMGGR